MANEVNITINAKDLASKRIKKVGAAFLAVGAAGAIALGTAAKSAADFEKGMREVNTLVGMSEDSLKSLSEQTLLLSSTMGIEAVDSTKALYQAISASVPPAEAIEFLGTAMRAAVGGVTDAETSVDALTTVINAFGMEASEAENVADLLFTTVKAGKTTFPELSESIGQVAGVASAMGVSFEELTAITSTATRAVGSTRIVMTGIRSAIISLAKPTSDMEGLIEGLGFASGKAAIEELGLQGAIQSLMDAAGGSDNLIKAGLTTEALSTVMAITGDQAKVFAKDYETAMGDVSGASAAAAAEIAKSSKHQAAVAKAQFEAMKVTIGTHLLPALNKVISVFGTVTSAVTKFAQENPIATKVVVLLAAAISVAALAFGALMLASLSAPAAVGAFGIASSIAAGLSSLLTVSLWAQVAAWIALNVATLGIGVAIAAVVTGIVLLIMNWDEVVRAVKIGANFMIGVIEIWANAYILAANKIIDALNKVAGVFGKEIDQIADVEIPRFNTAVEEMADVTDSETDAVNDALMMTQGVFVETADVAEKSSEKIAEATESASDRIREALGEQTRREIQAQKNRQLVADQQAKIREEEAAKEQAVLDEATERLAAAGKEQRRIWQETHDFRMELGEAEVAERERLLKIEEAASAEIIRIEEEEAARLKKLREETLADELSLAEFRMDAVKALREENSAAFAQIKAEVDLLPANIQTQTSMGTSREALDNRAGVMRAFKDSQNRMSDALEEAQAFLASGEWGGGTTKAMAQAEVDRLLGIVGRKEVKDAAGNVLVEGIAASAGFKGDALGALLAPKGGYGTSAPPMLPGMEFGAAAATTPHTTIVFNGDTYGLDDFTDKVNEGITEARLRGATMWMDRGEER